MQAHTRRRRRRLGLGLRSFFGLLGARRSGPLDFLCRHTLCWHTARRFLGTLRRPRVSLACQFLHTPAPLLCAGMGVLGPQPAPSFPLLPGKNFGRNPHEVLESPTLPVEAGTTALATVWAAPDSRSQTRCAAEALNSGGCLPSAAKAPVQPIIFIMPVGDLSRSPEAR